MIDGLTNPRSALHALEPYGRGTADVESLLSYFCRLAGSHSTTTLALSRAVAVRFDHDISARFDWHERQISGLRESALTWACALSALTSVQDLDRLTFLPWKEVISQNGLSIVSKGQFCPLCLHEDRALGHSPYFRLTWESKLVTVCHRHNVRLSQHCASCGRDNIRHAAAFVVPGWCTKCGEFLGRPDPVSADSAGIQPLELWQARQIGYLVSAQARMEEFPRRQQLMDTLVHVIKSMDGGKYSMFATRTGIPKSTVHHWFTKKGTPALEASLKVSAECGIALPQLFRNDLDGWLAPTVEQQRALELHRPESPGRAVARNIDWEEVDSRLKEFLELPTPISVLEAADRLELEARQLYHHANTTTRRLGERYKAYLKQRKAHALAEVRPHLEAACRKILAEGRAVTTREINDRVPKEVLSRVEGLIGVLRDVASGLAQA